MSTLSPEDTGPAASNKRPVLLPIGIAIWGGLVLAAICALTIYSMTPGEIESPPLATSAGIPVNASDFTLVMAVHPRCSCTLASVEQLDRLMTRFHDRITARILVFHLGQQTLDWAQTDVWDSMLRLPNVSLQPDPDGVLATQVGCRTSGSVVLYDRNGQPRFWGGITPGRGHSGDNPGSDQIADILSAKLMAGKATPVFGCSLRSPRIAQDQEANRLGTRR